MAGALCRSRQPRMPMHRRSSEVEGQQVPGSTAGRCLPESQLFTLAGCLASCFFVCKMGKAPPAGLGGGLAGTGVPSPMRPGTPVPPWGTGKREDSDGGPVGSPPVGELPGFPFLEGIPIPHPVPHGTTRGSRELRAAAPGTVPGGPPADEPVMGFKCFSSLRLTAACRQKTPNASC